MMLSPRLPLISNCVRRPAHRPRFWRTSAGVDARRGFGRQRGGTLIEVLISALLLGFGFVGLSALQTNTLRVNQSAFQRSQAVMLANFMMDAMRANRDAVLAGEYDLGSPTTPACNAPAGTTLASNDRTQWFVALKENLSDVDTTCGVIDCENARCTVQVYWDDSWAGGLSDQMVEITAEL